MTSDDHGNEPLPAGILHVSEVMRLVLQQHGIRPDERPDFGETSLTPGLAPAEGSSQLLATVYFVRWRWRGEVEVLLTISGFE